MFSGSSWSESNNPFKVFNVLDYGAVGDGDSSRAAANHTAIQAAIDAIPSSGGMLFFPAGTFYVNDVFTLKSNMRISGAADQATVIRQTDSTKGIFTGTDILYLTIENLGIRGTSSGSGIGIHFTMTLLPTADYVTVKNVTVLNFGGDGIVLDGAIVSTFENVVCNSNGGHGFSILTGTSVNFVSTYAVSNGEAGYNLSGIHYSTLTGCASDKNGIGYLITNQCSGISMTGCGVEQSTVIDGTWDGTGLKINNSFGITVNSLHLVNNAAIGVRVTGSAQNVVLSCIREVSPLAGATASIQVDAGSIVTLLGPPVVTTALNLSPKTTVFPDGGGSVIKTVTSFRNNTVTLANDPALFLFLFGNAQYIIDATIIYSASTTADLQMSWTGPSGATFSWCLDALDSSAAAVSGSVNRAVSVIGDGGVLIAGGQGAA